MLSYFRAEAYNTTLNPFYVSEIGTNKVKKLDILNNNSKSCPVVDDRKCAKARNHVVHDVRKQKFLENPPGYAAKPPIREFNLFKKANAGTAARASPVVCKHNRFVASIQFGSLSLDRLAGRPRPLHDSLVTTSLLDLTRPRSPDHPGYTENSPAHPGYREGMEADSSYSSERGKGSLSLVLILRAYRLF